MPTQKNTHAAENQAAEDVADAGIDLDELTREGDRPEPLTFKVAGQMFTLIDPVDVDWQIAVRVDPMNPHSVLSALMTDDDWAKFVDIDGLPQWKLLKLLEQIRKHYKLGESGALPLS